MPWWPGLSTVGKLTSLSRHPRWILKVGTERGNKRGKRKGQKRKKEKRGKGKEGRISGPLQLRETRLQNVFLILDSSTHKAQ